MYVFLRINVHKLPLTPPDSGPYEGIERKEKAFLLHITVGPRIWRFFIWWFHIWRGLEKFQNLASGEPALYLASFTVRTMIITATIFVTRHVCLHSPCITIVTQ